MEAKKQKFRQECLHGEKELFANIEIFDLLLAKVSPEKHISWTIRNLEEYLAIIYHRLNSESPSLKELEDKIKKGTKGESKEENKKEDEIEIKEKIKNINQSSKIKKYIEKGLEITLFSTSLFDKYNKPLYCLSIRESENDKLLYFDEGLFFTEKELRMFSDHNWKEKINYILDEYGLPQKASWGDLSYFNKSVLDIECDEYEDVELEKKLGNRKSLIETEGEKNTKKINNRLKNDREKGFSLTGWAHLIIDGSDNLPHTLVKSIFPGEFELYVDKYKLQKEIAANIHVYKCLKNLIDRAIKRSICEVERNPNIVAPMYYISNDNDNNNDEKKIISYLIPLYLTHQDQPDCVLLFNETDDGKYKARTLLNMAEAARDVRILGLLENYKWLY